MKIDGKHYHCDIESGEIYECTKEQWEAIHNMWEACKPTLKVPIGKIIVTGTGGDYQNGDLEKIFNQETNE